MARFIFPLVAGLGGFAILIWLGVWQLQRLDWKEARLAAIDARIAAPAEALPASPDPARDAFMPVRVTGTFTGEGLEVLGSLRDLGPGYRVIAVLQTDTGRRVLVDRGMIGEDHHNDPRTVTVATVTGNLHWPDEVDSYTPPPDAGRNLWFARDVPAMARALNAEPVLIVAREATGDGIEPLPLDSSTIPNDHLNYAITWFSTAFVWLGMTALLVWRIRQRSL